MVMVWDGNGDDDGRRKVKGCEGCCGLLWGQT